MLVECRPTGSAVWSAPEAATDGGFRLTGLAPGRHVVRARVLGVGIGTPRCSPEVEVDVAAGATSEVELRMPSEGARR